MQLKKGTNKSARFTENWYEVKIVTENTVKQRAPIEGEDFQENFIASTLVYLCVTYGW